MRTYRVITDFCGAGFGALGAQRVRVEKNGTRAGFELLGGFDVDATACASFRQITGIAPLCADVRKLQPADLRARYGSRAPDFVFGSPPCQGASRMLSNEKAAEPAYAALNELVEVWIDLLLATWKPGPTVIGVENVPGIVWRAKDTVKRVREKLRAAGYVFHDAPHETGRFGTKYDAGGLAGAAQRRERWLLLARDPKRCPAPIRLPPEREHRGVGSVLGQLPIPTFAGQPTDDPMHVLPDVHLLQALRLALIPAGGDHRDLPGVLAEHEKRREKFRRHHVTAWSESSPTIGGSGSNGAQNVQDPRVRCERYSGAYGVIPWEEPAKTIAASAKVDNRPVSVADPRPGEWRRDTLGVVPWDERVGTITGEASPTTGRFSVADPRVPRAFDAGYGVISWDQPSRTIAGLSAPGNGAYAVADPRPEARGAAPIILPIEEALAFLDTPGPWAIVDRSSDGAPIAVIRSLRAPAPIPIIIVSSDDTWHRPFTPRELAALQGLPLVVRGQLAQLAGFGATSWRRQIGNALPVYALEAIGGSVAQALLESELGAWSLCGDGGIWVQQAEAVQ